MQFCAFALDGSLHQLCIDKCHENGWNVDMLLRDPVPGLVTLNCG